jgi:glutamate dehydrogenase
VFDRGAKAIPVSPQMRALLDLEGDTASGEEVIKKILTARVDLLYNGGIGTYVKASSETDVQVGDRTNDRVRVNARELRCRVIGEGGNLGLTQKARLEYAANGGLVNTDAVDNSGGVDTSDHEVNIKILMDVLVKKGVVRGREERNRILAEMTEEVAALVLADNENQARCITLDNLRSAARYEEFVAFIEELVSAGVINRKDESLPTRDELLASPQRERGLPRPLLAVLLGYVKMWAFQVLLETDYPDRAEARRLLDGYFPRRLQAQFREYFPEHRLRREIIGTVAVNHLINEAGVTFLARVMGETKAGLAEVVAAWLRVDAESQAEALRARVQGSRLGAQREQELLLQIEGRLEELTRAALTGERVDAAGALDGVVGALA